MGVNWNSGVLFWQDHAPSANECYTLSHLHPFVQRIELAADLPAFLGPLLVLG